MAVLGLPCCMQVFSSCGKWELLFIVVHGFLIAVASLVWSTGCGHIGFSTWWHTGSVVVEHGLSCSVACGIFLDQNRTCVSCIGRQILIHCTTREVWKINFFKICDFIIVLSSKTISKYLIMQCRLVVLDSQA